MTKHISNWKAEPNQLMESWKEIYWLYFTRQAKISRQRNRIILTMEKDYYQRIIKLPK